MGFPENVLTADETVVKELHPHPVTVLGPVVLGLVLTAVAVAIAVITPDSTAANVLQWVCVAVAVLAGFWFTVVPVLRWRTTHFVITTHRVMVRRGIIGKSGKDITLSKIVDVSFVQTALDRIIRSGTLHIESAGDSPDEDLTNIPRSNEVQQLINRLVDDDANRRSAVMQDRLAGRAQVEPDPAAGSPLSDSDQQDVEVANRHAAGPAEPGRGDERAGDLGEVGAMSDDDEPGALGR